MVTIYGGGGGEHFNLAADISIIIASRGSREAIAVEFKLRRPMAILIDKARSDGVHFRRGISHVELTCYSGELILQG